MSEQNPQAHSELASFGEELRREREIRGISLKEIADSTKISRRFLEAIERNDHKTLPAPVFTRGFVREYARYLGLNTEEIVNRYNFAAAGDDRIEKNDHLDRLVHPEPQGTETTPPPAQRKPANIPRASALFSGAALITILLVAVLGAAVWWAMSAKRARQSAAAEPVLPTTALAAPAPRPAVPATASETNAADDSRLYLKMEVTSNSWIALEVDGEIVVNEVLRAGTTRTFEADRQFRFRSIGNAAGVNLTLNDTRLPPLGEEGEVVRNRVIDREVLEKVRAGSGVETS